MQLITHKNHFQNMLFLVIFGVCCLISNNTCATQAGVPPSTILNTSNFSSSSAATTPVYNPPATLIAASLFTLLLTILITIYFTKKLQQAKCNKNQCKNCNNGLCDKGYILNQFMESTYDCLWNMDISTNTIERSFGFEKVFGYKHNEISTGPDWWYERLHPEDNEKVMHAFNQAIQSGDTVLHVEYRFQRKDGSYALIDDHITIIRDENGKPVRCMGAMHDISQGQATKEELLKVHNSLQQIYTALDNIGIGIHMVDTDGRFFYVNEAAANMLGYSQAELVNMSVPEIDLNFPADRFREIAKSFRTTEPGRLETTQVTKDGKTLPVEVNFNYFPGETEDDEGFFISFNEDLTRKKLGDAEQQRLHEQLVRSRRMEMVGQLSGGLAHDFNNILGAILGYSELLQYQVDSDSINRSKCNHYLNQVFSSVNRARDIVSQMLIYSRQTDEQPMTDRPAIASWPIVDEAVRLLKASIPAPVKIKTIVENEDITVNIAEGQLHQVILNLGINARDAITDYGTITIRQSCEYLSGSCDSCHTDFQGEYVVISIEDSGSGISPELINSIFDPFFSTKRPGKGSGMGLSITHGIIHNAGGHITIDQNEPQGTVIRIILPVTSEQEYSQQVPAQIDPGNNVIRLDGLNILVVDDEVNLCNVLKDLLSKHGANVTAHHDPLCAYRDFQAKSDQFDLLITDMSMPELSGLDLSKKILQSNPDIPIIMCTGYSEHINPEKARQVGINRFLYKPVNLNSMLVTVAELCLLSEQEL